MIHEINIRDIGAQQSFIATELLKRDQARLKARIKEVAQKVLDDYLIGISLTITHEMRLGQPEIIIKATVPD